MKTKGAIEMSANTISILILGITILVILIAGFSYGWGWLIGEKFIITKEVCHNETVSELSFPEDFKNIECPEYVEKKNSTICYSSIGSIVIMAQDGYIYTRYDQRSLQDDTVINLLREVCEQQEVDYIKSETINTKWLDKCTLPIPNTTMIMGIEGGEEILSFTISGITIQNCYALIPKTIIKVISKEDITQDWLNENCEILERRLDNNVDMGINKEDYKEGSRYCKLNYRNSEIAWDENEQRFSCYNYIKYKCGDYIVEVSK